MLNFLSDLHDHHGFWPIVSVWFFILLCYTSLFGLLGVWAGVGRGRWFWRLGVVLGCVALLLFIPAYELVYFYLIQAGVLFAVSTVWRQRHPLRSAGDKLNDGNASARWQFSIADLLLLTFFVACGCAMLCRTPAEVRECWPELTIAAAFLGLGTLMSVSNVYDSSKLWRRWANTILLFPAVLIIAWLTLYRIVCEKDNRRCKMFFRILFTAMTLLIAVPIIASYWYLITPPAMPPSPIIRENPYQLLVSLGQSLSSVKVPPDMDTATQAELKCYVAQCGKYLEDARALLLKPGCVTPRPFSRETTTTKLFNDWDAMRELRHALQGQGRLAVFEGRKDDALSIYKDLICLGRIQENGGLIINWLVGVTFEDFGHAEIGKMRLSLTAEECRKALKILLDRPPERSVFEKCLVREEIWGAITGGWTVRLGNFVQMAIYHKVDNTLNMEKVYRLHATTYYLLVCELAARAYLLEHGRPPDKLADLVPNYLKQTPTNPLDGKEFFYRPTTAGFELRTAEKYPIGSSVDYISVDKH
jgi:hypothetical protein